MEPLVRFARESLEQGSRSFAAAARLLPPETRDSASLLYACCRHCDDLVDGQAGGFATDTAGDATPAERLARLEAQVHVALAGGQPRTAVLQALQRVVQRHGIPERCVLDLLAGFRMDVEGRRYVEIEDTLHYAYHVAGVVGVMMAMVMGVDDEDALDRASDLGIAMQLTNIARDVVDDAAIGRCYLPARWLAEAGIGEASVAAPENRAPLAGVTARLLSLAEPYYASGTAGLTALGFREAWAIAAARSIYRAIGIEVCRRGTEAWNSRVTTGRARKLALLLAALARAGYAWSAGRRRPLPPRSGLWTRPRRWPAGAWSGNVPATLSGSRQPLTGDANG